MNKYKIVIIDDELTAECSGRKAKYSDFLESELLENDDTTFDVIYIEHPREVQNILSTSSNEIDAFFIDARLEESDKGWGIDAQTFDSVLVQIENTYKDEHVPPIFLISKHWAEQFFLSKISKSFAVFHEPLHPTRFYTVEELDNWITKSKTKNSSGKGQIESLVEERNYIKEEIKKYRNLKYNSIEPIDMVVVVAVKDEKDVIYNYLGLKNNDIIDKKHGISYQIAKYDGMNLAVVSLADMGLTDAARVATASIIAFRPKMISMVGICAGKKDSTVLGDIIIASDVFDYSKGKINSNSKLTHRPKSYPIKEVLRSYVANNIVSKSDEILLEIKGKYNGNISNNTNGIKLGVMGSGPWVVDNKDVFENIKNEINSQCISIDMEAFAIASAAEHFDIPWIVIKGVQDFADGEKGKTESTIRRYAAYSSVYLLMNYTKDLLDAII